MIITPIPGSNVYSLRHNRVYWKLVGPNGLPECPQKWTVYASTEHEQWRVIPHYKTKWQAIHGLLTFINNPW